MNHSPGPSPAVSDDDADLHHLIPSAALAGSADANSQPEIFHERTKLHRGTLMGLRGKIVKFLTVPSFIARSSVGCNEYPYLEPIALPPPLPMETSLAQSLKTRVSRREFGDAISLEQVSSLFHYALRPTRRMRPEILPYLEFPFRPYPSPGNLNSLEPYAFLQSVPGVDPCVVHYDQREHQFRKLSKSTRTGFSQVEVSDEGKAGIVAPLVIVLTMIPQRMTQKYGDRGYRFSLLEAGHASQNICLVAEGLGLGSLVYASFYDDELAVALGIDGVTEVVASVILIGPRKPAPAP